MLTVKKILAFFCTVFLVISSVLAQDSLGAIKDWKVVSKKLDKGKYELSFSGTISGGWQVYAPNQVLLEIKTTELKFADSSIVQQGDFVLQTKPTEISSAIFENTKVSVYETAVEWKTVIEVSGTVPAKLSGTLYYTYGKEDEFYPATSFFFIVSMEDGVESTWQAKVASIDINNPVSPCGDDGTKDKSLLTIFFLGLLGGLIALLTPCVFPMIPVTVTFFTKKSAGKKAE